MSFITKLIDPNNIMAIATFHVVKNDKWYILSFARSPIITRTNIAIINILITIHVRQIFDTDDGFLSSGINKNLKIYSQLYDTYHIFKYFYIINFLRILRSNLNS